MFYVYKVGGVLLGVQQTIVEARELLRNHAVGWIICSGSIIEKKGF
jgi:hypothetical protein